MKFSTTITSLCWALAAFPSTLANNNNNNNINNIVIGSVPSPIGWTDGVCYEPLSGVKVGDTLQFNFNGHNLYKMDSMAALEDCNFDTATLLAEIGSTQEHTYTVTEADERAGQIYFACQIGAHCGSGNQKLVVNIDQTVNEEETILVETMMAPVSRFISGRANCTGLTETDFTQHEAQEGGVKLSSCTTAEQDEEGVWHTSCLSAPVPLTPGGVINQLQFMHYPYPKDRRVKSALRTWEFVADVPDTEGEVEPVPINQLYVHHLSGRVILGQGTEGIRQSAPDAPFPEPYGLITGDEGDSMVFHIIDLREVDDWLACIECRCQNGNGTYLDTTSERDEFGVLFTGGVNCCTNCTSLATPTIDYRMRYNVSYTDIEDEVVKELQMITADISPRVGANIEFDVPQAQYLPLDQIKDGMPNVQRLTREGPFRDLFQMEFFAGPYAGPDTVRIFRCVGHLHVAAIGMWLEDVVTGETLCANIGQYGNDPSADKGFLNALSVTDHEEPKIISADHPVRLVSEYNATEFHTGVMGMWFLFIDAERDLTRMEAALNIELCQATTCDYAALPELEPVSLEDSCVDTLEESPLCRFASICTCEALFEQSEGCGGMFESEMGSMPVNDLCQATCGCPDIAGATAAEDNPGSITFEEAASPSSSSGCEDKLAENPACTFGGLCDCEEFVNSEESTGCGGVYASAMGDIAINDVCAAYCDACPDESEGPTADALMEEQLVEQLEEKLASLCLYATTKCRRTLNAMYSCGMQMSASMEEEAEADNVAAVTERSGNAAAPAISETIIRKHGTRLALEYSKLGHPSLHVGQPEQVVAPCKDDNGNGAILDMESSATANEEASSAASWSSFFNMIGAVALASLSFGLL